MAVARKYCHACDRDVKAEQKDFNHVPHILATALLCGCWIPFWLLALSDKRPWHCSVCGAKILKQQQ